MNWLTNYVRPKIQAALEKRKETPENLWIKCRDCDQMIFQKEFSRNLSVCPTCGYHGRICPTERFKMLFDDGAYQLLPQPKVVEDPLKFRDQRKYTERLKTARLETGDKEALLVGSGTLGGLCSVIAVQNFAFLGGSMGLGVGEAMIAGVKKAVKLKAPFIMFTAAGGARMQEGILSLMQMPRTTVAVEMLRDAGLPYIVVLTDPTTGGVTASYAMLGDVAIAEPGALIAFAGARVIENTIREQLPEGFQRAEYLLEHGMIDMVVARKDLRDTLIRITSMLMKKPALKKA
jgi:acetyl-CoA carboxylase carboxyl transferase subunit beta